MGAGMNSQLLEDLFPEAPSPSQCSSNRLYRISKVLLGGTPICLSCSILQLSPVDSILKHIRSSFSPHAFPSWPLLSSPLDREHFPHNSQIRLPHPVYFSLILFVCVTISVLLELPCLAWCRVMTFLNLCYQGSWYTSL